MNTKIPLRSYTQLTVPKCEFLTRCSCGGTVDLDPFTMAQFCHKCGTMWTLRGKVIPGDYFRSGQIYVTLEE